MKNEVNKMSEALMEYSALAANIGLGWKLLTLTSVFTVYTRFSKNFIKFNLFSF